MRVFVDVTPLYDLGMVGELGLLTGLDGEPVVTEAVRSELDVEPAATNLSTMIDDGHFGTVTAPDDHRTSARTILGDAAPEVDVSLVASLLAERDGDDDTGPGSDREGERPAAIAADVGFVSDDRRLRRLADGLGASVTGTFGVVARAAVSDKYFSPSQAKRVIRRTDGHGLQTTGPLRERAIGDVGES